MSNPSEIRTRGNILKNSLNLVILKERGGEEKRVYFRRDLLSFQNLCFSFFRFYS